MQNQAEIIELKANGYSCLSGFVYGKRSLIMAWKPKFSSKRDLIIEAVNESATFFEYFSNLQFRYRIFRDIQSTLTNVCDIILTFLKPFTYTSCEKTVIHKDFLRKLLYSKYLKE